MLSILNKNELRRVLAYVLDENEFLGPYGIRSLSKYRFEYPFVFHVGGEEYKVQYLPGESNTAMFGGNSNWWGPVWMPVNALIVRALLNLYQFYVDEFTVQCPTGSGRYMTLFEVAQELTRRLTGTFLRDSNGRRPITAVRQSSRTIRTGATSICFTSTSTATTAQGSAPAITRAGPLWSLPSWIFLGVSTLKLCSRLNAGAR